MKIQVLIERGKDGSYSAYIAGDNPLDFGAIGEGDTAEEAKTDFMNVIESFRDDGCVPDDAEFVFAFDVPSFLAYYSNVLTLSGLSRLTGVAQGQLSHYVTGRRHPSAKTIIKIQEHINKFGKDLSMVHFV